MKINRHHRIRSCLQPFIRYRMFERISRLFPICSNKSPYCTSQQIIELIMFIPTLKIAQRSLTSLNKSCFLNIPNRTYKEWSKKRPIKKTNVRVDPQTRIINQVSSVLDDSFVREDRSKPIRERGKLSQPLIKLPEYEQRVANKESLILELEDILTETIEGSAFSKIIPGVNDLSTVIEFSKISINQDNSHVHVEWTSTSLFEFYSKLYDSASGTPEGGKAPYTIHDCDQFESRIQRLTNDLQHREGFFRTAIIHKINFRRVPRVYFQVEPDLKELLKDLRKLLTSGEIRFAPGDDSF